MTNVLFTNAKNKKKLKNVLHFFVFHGKPKLSNCPEIFTKNTVISKQNYLTSAKRNYE